MIAYFDTSAVVPLLVQEAGSERANLLWNEADRIASVRLVYAEGRAALAMAARLGRIDQIALRLAVDELDRLYQQMDHIEVTDTLIWRAGVLAEDYSLRGYDAVHLAAAEVLRAESLVFVAGDDLFCKAAEILGLAVAHT